MNTPQTRQWLIRGAVLFVVFLGALSMHLERVRGWGFLLLCFVVGSIGGLGFFWAKRRFQVVWDRQPQKRRGLLIATAIAMVLVATFISNYGNPDSSVENLAVVVSITFAVALWFLYRLFSRVINAIWARFVNRPVQRTPTEVIELIKSALETGGDSKWDDFVSVSIADPELEIIRRRCLEVNLAPKAQFDAALHAILSELKG